jgi:hypothetical protein
VDGYVCTLCCGKTRKAEACQGCSFYKEPELPPKYDKVPAYTVRQMNNSMDLQAWSNAIEGAIGAFDRDTGRTINDDVPIRIMELLLDNYYFKEEVLAFDNELIEKGFYQVNQAIQDELYHFRFLLQQIGALAKLHEPGRGQMYQSLCQVIHQVVHVGK